MLKNFLKVAYRNLLKNKGSSFVNIFGLSVAVGCSIVVFLFLEMQFTMDRFHENGERIFLVENIIDRDGNQQLWGDAPRPLGLAMKVSAGTGVKTAEAVEASWKRLFPDQPYIGFFQDTVFERFYRETTNIKRVFAFVALMALIISCMGLFGLAAQNIARRMKEISIRKVLGATVASVSTRINRGFLALLLVAAVIAMPLSYLLLGALLESIYAFPMPLGPAPFVWAFVLVFATATGAISSLIYKIVVTNPAEVLRNE